MDQMLKLILDRIIWFLTLLSGLLLIAIVVCVILAVFDRTLLHIGLFWTEEMARILFVWFAMIAPGIMAAKEAHFKMSYFHDRIFKGRTKFVVAILIHFMIIVMLMEFVFSGFELTALVAPQRLPSIRSGSMALLYTALPVGMGIMAFINVLLVIEKMIRLITNRINVEEGKNKGGTLHGL
jgi:TRAP-type C4-dicarboxylate transport system permease small subunit